MKASSSLLGKSPFSLQNEIEFWGHQIAEHQQIIYSGLVDKDAIKTGNTGKHLNQNVLNLRDEAMFHHKTWKKLSSSTNIEEISEEIKETIDYQSDIYDTIGAGIFVGYLYPSLLEHMNTETGYFLDKIGGGRYNLDSEIEFWISHHKGETTVAEKQLDPKEKDLSKIIRSYDDFLEELEQNLERGQEDIDYVLDEYDKLNKDLLKKSSNGDVLSINSSFLIEHAIREGKRAQQIFEWFADQ